MLIYQLSFSYMLYKPFKYRVLVKFFLSILWHKEDGTKFYTFIKSLRKLLSDVILSKGIKKNTGTYPV